MKQFYIEIKDMKVRVTEWGCKDNQTVICIHGLGGSSLSFIEIGEMLQDKYHFVSIDLPGHGRTATFSYELGYEMSNLIEWVNEVVLLLGYNNFNILAHSWGGDITLHYAVKYPQKVNKILLIDGGYYLKHKQYEYMNTSLEDNMLLLQSTLPGNWLEVREYLSDFFKKNTNAVVKQIKNVAHMMHWDNPEVVADELIKHFK